MTSILIVGAGPVGLTLAIQLRRFGVEVDLIDGAAQPSSETKAMAIHARTLELLRDLGVGAPFLAHGKQVKRFAAYHEGRPILHYEFARLDALYPFLLTLPQPDSERFLLARLAELGTRPAWGHALLELTQDARAVTTLVRAPDGTRQSARYAYVIGCDGARSTVRKQLGLSFEGASYRRHFMLCDVDLDWQGSPEEGAFFLGRGDGYIGLAPIPGDNRYRFFVEMPTPLPPLEARPTLDVELFQRIADARGQRMRLSRASSLTMAEFRHRMVDRLRVGRVFLAGDAAHTGSPIGGQYMNLGIQEAYNLGWKLAYVARGLALPSLLDSYDAERMPVARQAERTAHRLTRLLTVESPWLRTARNLALPLLCKLDAVRDRLPRGVSGHAQVYRSSGALANQDARVRRISAARRTLRVRAGDLAPDLRMPDGSRTIDWLDGERYTVLLFAGEVASPERFALLSRTAARLEARHPRSVVPIIVWPSARAGARADENGRLHARYGAAAGGCFVVRPDGHIGYAGPDGLEHELMRYLGKTLRELESAEVCG